MLSRPISARSAHLHGFVSLMAGAFLFREGAGVIVELHECSLQCDRIAGAVGCIEIEDHTLLQRHRRLCPGGAVGFDVFLCRIIG